MGAVKGFQQGVCSTHTHYSFLFSMSTWAGALDYGPAMGTGY